MPFDTSVGLLTVNLLTSQREAAVRDRYNLWTWAILSEVGLNTSLMEAKKGIRSEKLRKFRIVSLVMMWMLLALAAEVDWLR